MAYTLCWSSLELVGNGGTERVGGSVNGIDAYPPQHVRVLGTACGAMLRVIRIPRNTPFGTLSVHFPATHYLPDRNLWVMMHRAVAPVGSVRIDHLVEVPGT